MRHAMLLLALCAGTCPVSASAEPDDEAARKANGQAFTEIQKKRSDKALELLAPHIARVERAIAAAEATGLAFCAPDPGEALVYASLAAGQKKSATVFGDAACETIFLKAYALTELGRKEEALATMQRLTALAPMHGHYFIELGYSYRVAGQLEEARKAYQAVIDMPPLAQDSEAIKRDRAAAFRGLGYLLIDKGDLDGAEASYRRSLEIEPDNAISRSELDFIADKRREPAP